MTTEQTHVLFRVQTVWKIGIFWNYRPVWLRWVSGDEQWRL